MVKAINPSFEAPAGAIKDFETQTKIKWIDGVIKYEDTKEVQKLILNLTGNKGGTGQGSVTPNYQDTTLTENILTGKGNLTFKGNGANVNIPNLEINFQKDTQIRKFIMDFRTSSFTGGIATSGGTANKTGAVGFQAIFGRNVTGNITLDNKTENTIPNNIDNLTANVNYIEFTGEAKLQGNLAVKDGVLILKVADGDIDSIQLQSDPQGGTKNPKIDINITGKGSIKKFTGMADEGATSSDSKKSIDLALASTSSLGIDGDSRLTSLTFSGTNTVDLSQPSTARTNGHKVLTIETLKTDANSQSLTFISRVSKDGADKVIIDGKTGEGTQTYSMQVIADENAKGNTSIIATVKKEGDKGIIDLGKTATITQSKLTGSFNLKTQETDKDGGTTNTNYVSYKLDGLSGETTESTPDNKPTPPEVIYQGQKEAESTISVSTDLFLANFNSLNKRMGDLRDNANSQGIWARVFHGSQSNAFTTIESKSKYVTIQGGYDYGFALDNGAKNYLGLALSYGHSSLSQQDTEIGKSDLVEFALYNSYIEDAGWYNDTIAKFSYLMNAINSNNTELNNFAFLFSDEFGYRFKLGASKEWFIDPQLELSVAYINGGKLKDQNVTTDIASMMILKNRLGSSFGYEFKNDKSTLKLYAGGFYEFDYFNSDISKWSGNILGHSVSGEVKNSLNNQIDHRFVLNLGMNAEIEKNTRIYFDFEKSFAGKITTDYKFNIGARYAFGQTADKAATNDTNKAPIKLDDSKQAE